MARRFAEAFTAADIDRVVALLTDEAWLSMPPAPHEYHGRPAIAEFLRASTPSTARGGGPWCRSGPTTSPRSACT